MSYRTISNCNCSIPTINTDPLNSSLKSPNQTSPSTATLKPLHLPPTVPLSANIPRLLHCYTRITLSLWLYLSHPTIGFNIPLPILFYNPCTKLAPPNQHDHIKLEYSPTICHIPTCTDCLSYMERYLFLCNTTVCEYSLPEWDNLKAISTPFRTTFSPAIMFSQSTYTTIPTPHITQSSTSTIHNTDNDSETNPFFDNFDPVQHCQFSQNSDIININITQFSNYSDYRSFIDSQLAVLSQSVIKTPTSHTITSHNKQFYLTCPQNCSNLGHIPSNPSNNEQKIKKSSKLLPFNYSILSSILQSQCPIHSPLSKLTAQLRQTPSKNPKNGTSTPLLPPHAITPALISDLLSYRKNTIYPHPLNANQAHFAEINTSSAMAPVFCTAGWVDLIKIINIPLFYHLINNTTMIHWGQSGGVCISGHFTDYSLLDQNEYHSNFHVDKNNMSNGSANSTSYLSKYLKLPYNTIATTLFGLQEEHQRQRLIHREQLSESGQYPIQIIITLPIFQFYTLTRMKLSEYQKYKRLLSNYRKKTLATMTSSTQKIFIIKPSPNQSSINPKKSLSPLTLNQIPIAFPSFRRYFKPKIKHILSEISPNITYSYYHSHFSGKMEAFNGIITGSVVFHKEKNKITESKITNITTNTIKNDKDGTKSNLFTTLAHNNTISAQQFPSKPPLSLSPKNQKNMNTNTFDNEPHLSTKFTKKSTSVTWLLKNKLLSMNTLYKDKIIPSHSQKVHNSFRNWLYLTFNTTIETNKLFKPRYKSTILKIIANNTHKAFLSAINLGTLPQFMMNNLKNDKNNGKKRKLNDDIDNTLGLNEDQNSAGIRGLPQSIDLTQELLHDDALSQNHLNNHNTTNNKSNHTSLIKQNMNLSTARSVISRSFKHHKPNYVDVIDLSSPLQVKTFKDHSKTLKNHQTVDFNMDEFADMDFGTISTTFTPTAPLLSHSSALGTQNTPIILPDTPPLVPQSVPAPGPISSLIRTSTFQLDNHQYTGRDDNPQISSQQNPKQLTINNHISSHYNHNDSIQFSTLSFSQHFPTNDDIITTNTTQTTIPNQYQQDFDSIETSNTTPTSSPSVSPYQSPSLSSRRLRHPIQLELQYNNKYFDKKQKIEEYRQNQCKISDKYQVLRETTGGTGLKRTNPPSMKDITNNTPISEKNNKKPSKNESKPFHDNTILNDTDVISLDITLNTEKHSSMTGIGLNLTNLPQTPQLSHISHSSRLSRHNSTVNQSSEISISSVNSNFSNPDQYVQLPPPATGKWPQTDSVNLTKNQLKKREKNTARQIKLQQYRSNCIVTFHIKPIKNISQDTTNPIKSSNIVFAEYYTSSNSLHKSNPIITPWLKQSLPIPLTLLQTYQNLPKSIPNDPISPQSQLSAISFPSHQSSHALPQHNPLLYVPLVLQYAPEITIKSKNELNNNKKSYKMMLSQYQPWTHVLLSFIFSPYCSMEYTKKAKYNYLIPFNSMLKNEKIPNNLQIIPNSDHIPLNQSEKTFSFDDSFINTLQTYKNTKTNTFSNIQRTGLDQTLSIDQYVALVENHSNILPTDEDLSFSMFFDKNQNTSKIQPTEAIDNSRLRLLNAISDKPYDKYNSINIDKILHNDIDRNSTSTPSLSIISSRYGYQNHQHKSHHFLPPPTHSNLISYMMISLRTAFRCIPTPISSTIFPSHMHYISAPLSSPPLSSPPTIFPLPSPDQQKQPPGNFQNPISRATITKLLPLLSQLLFHFHSINFEDIMERSIFTPPRTAEDLAAQYGLVQHNPNHDNSKRSQKRPINPLQDLFDTQMSDEITKNNPYNTLTQFTDDLDTSISQHYGNNEAFFDTQVSYEVDLVNSDGESSQISTTEQKMLGNLELTMADDSDRNNPSIVNISSQNDRFTQFVTVVGRMDTPNNQIYTYLMEVLIQLIPIPLFGSKKNVDRVCKNLLRYVLSNKEDLLHELILVHGLNFTVISWLPKQRLSTKNKKNAKNQRKTFLDGLTQQEHTWLVLQVIKFILFYILLPHLHTVFQRVPREGQRDAFYIYYIWKTIVNLAKEDMEHHFEEINLTKGDIVNTIVMQDRYIQRIQALVTGNQNNDNNVSHNGGLNTTIPSSSSPPSNTLNTSVMNITSAIAPRTAPSFTVTIDATFSSSLNNHTAFFLPRVHRQNNSLIYSLPPEKSWDTNISKMNMVLKTSGVRYIVNHSYQAIYTIMLTMLTQASQYSNNLLSHNNSLTSIQHNPSMTIQNRSGMLKSTFGRLTRHSSINLNDSTNKSQSQLPPPQLPTHSQELMFMSVNKSFKQYLHVLREAIRIYSHPLFFIPYNLQPSSEMLSVSSRTFIYNVLTQCLGIDLTQNNNNSIHSTNSSIFHQHNQQLLSHIGTRPTLLGSACLDSHDVHSQLLRPVQLYSQYLSLFYQNQVHMRSTHLGTQLNIATSSTKHTSNFMTLQTITPSINLLSPADRSILVHTDAIRDLPAGSDQAPETVAVPYIHINKPPQPPLFNYQKSDENISLSPTQQQALPTWIITIDVTKCYDNISTSKLSRLISRILNNAPLPYNSIPSTVLSTWLHHYYNLDIDSNSSSAPKNSQQQQQIKSFSQKRVAKVIAGSTIHDDRYTIESFSTLDPPILNPSSYKVTDSSSLVIDGQNQNHKNDLKLQKLNNNDTESSHFSQYLIHSHPLFSKLYHSVIKHNIYFLRNASCPNTTPFNTKIKKISSYLTRKYQAKCAQRSLNSTKTSKPPKSPVYSHFNNSLLPATQSILYKLLPNSQYKSRSLRVDKIREAFQHLFHSVIIQLHQKYYRQFKGIPQGNVLSSLFANLWLGQAERETRLAQKIANYNHTVTGQLYHHLTYTTKAPSLYDRSAKTMTIPRNVSIGKSNNATFPKQPPTTITATSKSIKNSGNDTQNMPNDQEKLVIYWDYVLLRKMDDFLLMIHPTITPTSTTTTSLQHALSIIPNLIHTLHLLELPIKYEKIQSNFDFTLSFKSPFSIQQHHSHVQPPSTLNSHSTVVNISSRQYIKWNGTLLNTTTLTTMNDYSILYRDPTINLNVLSSYYIQQKYKLKHRLETFFYIPSTDASTNPNKKTWVTFLLQRLYNPRLKPHLLSIVLNNVYTSLLNIYQTNYIIGIRIVLAVLFMINRSQPYYLSKNPHQWGYIDLYNNFCSDITTSVSWYNNRVLRTIATTLPPHVITNAVNLNANAASPSHTSIGGTLLARKSDLKSLIYETFIDVTILSQHISPISPTILPYHTVFPYELLKTSEYNRLQQKVAQKSNNGQNITNTTLPQKSSHHMSTLSLLSKYIKFTSYIAIVDAIDNATLQFKHFSPDQQKLSHLKNLATSARAPIDIKSLSRFTDYNYDFNLHQKTIGKNVPPCHDLDKTMKMYDYDDFSQNSDKFILKSLKSASLFATRHYLHNQAVNLQNVIKKTNLMQYNQTNNCNKGINSSDGDYFPVIFESFIYNLRNDTQHLFMNISIPFDNFLAK